MVYSKTFWQHWNKPNLHMCFCWPKKYRQAKKKWGKNEEDLKKIKNEDDLKKNKKINGCDIIVN